MVRHRFIVELHFEGVVREHEALAYLSEAVDSGSTNKFPSIVKAPETKIHPWKYLREMIMEVGRKYGIQPGAKTISSQI